MGKENLAFWMAGASLQEYSDIDMYDNSESGRQQKEKEFEAMRKATGKLFSKAEDNIKIVTGRFSHEFYCSKEIVGAIEQALARKSRKCTVEIIAGPNADEESISFWKSHERVSVNRLEQWPEKHFAIVDGKHVRIENPHAPQKEKREQYIIYNFKNVDVVMDEFEKLKKQIKVSGTVAETTA